MTPPNAPRRYSNFGKVERPKELWEFIRDRGHVRSKYLSYTPEDVEEIDCLDTLRWLYEKYNPSDQPRNMDECVYWTIMAIEVKKKILRLENE